MNSILSNKKINNDTKYKEKYLKYKKKYLELKGGANCPTIGFHQHDGECWNDVCMTILIYTDGISEGIQELFDAPIFNNDIEEGVRHHLTRVISESPKYLLPYNIPESYVENPIFIRIITNYLTNFIKRYRNDKAKLSYQATDEEKTKGLVRQDSSSMSFACVDNIIKILNANIKHREHRESGGTIVNNIINASMFNYLFFYRLNKLLTVKEYVFDRICNRYMDIVQRNENIRENILDANEFLNKKLDEIIKIIRKERNILINYQSHSKEENYGHIVGVLQCNGKQIFYDNEGQEEDDEDEEEDEDEDKHPRGEPFSTRTTKDIDIKIRFIESLTKLKGYTRTHPAQFFRWYQEHNINFLSYVLTSEVNDASFWDTHYIFSITIFELNDFNYHGPQDMVINEYYNRTENYKNIYQQQYNNTRRINNFVTHINESMGVTYRSKIIDDEPLIE